MDTAGAQPTPKLGEPTPLKNPKQFASVGNSMKSTLGRVRTAHRLMGLLRKPR